MKKTESSLDNGIEKLKFPYIVFRRVNCSNILENCLSISPEAEHKLSLIGSDYMLLDTQMKCIKMSNWKAYIQMFTATYS